MPLRVAGLVHEMDLDFHRRELVPRLARPGVEVMGEVGPAAKADLLGRARALLFPIGWEEPFGLVMIEAMACGTPVIAWRRGSVGEVIRDGLTGFVVESMAEAVRAVERLPTIDRARCRTEFDRRFTVDRMAGEYLRVYEQLARFPKQKPKPARLDLESAGARGA